MGKLRRLKKLRRALRGTQRTQIDLALCKADPAAYVELDSEEGRAELAKLHPPPLRIRYAGDDPAGVDPPLPF